jgi:flagellar biosynthesis protein FlhB
MLLLMVLGVAVTLAQTSSYGPANACGQTSPGSTITGFKTHVLTPEPGGTAQSAAQAGLIGFVAYSYLRGNIQHLMELSQFDLLTGMQVFMDMVFSLSLRAGGAYLVLQSPTTFINAGNTCAVCE